MRLLAIALILSGCVSGQSFEPCPIATVYVTLDSAALADSVIAEDSIIPEECE